MLRPICHYVLDGTVPVPTSYAAAPIPEARDIASAPSFAARFGAEHCDPSGDAREMAPLRAQSEALAAELAQVRAQLDGVYDRTVKPVAEQYWNVCQARAAIPVGDATRISRAWHLGLLEGLRVGGDRIAAALDVAPPEWTSMYESSLPDREAP